MYDLEKNIAIRITTAVNSCKLFFFKRFLKRRVEINQMQQRDMF